MWDSGSTLFVVNLLHPGNHPVTIIEITFLQVTKKQRMPNLLAVTFPEGPWQVCSHCGWLFLGIILPFVIGSLPHKQIGRLHVDSSFCFIKHRFSCICSFFRSQELLSAVEQERKRRSRNRSTPSPTTVISFPEDFGIGQVFHI